MRAVKSPLAEKPVEPSLENGMILDDFMLPDEEIPSPKDLSEGKLSSIVKNPLIVAASIFVTGVLLDKLRR